MIRNVNKQEVTIMNTSLVVFDRETAHYKYEIAMCIFRMDMQIIKDGMGTESNYDSEVMNMYIDEAISLLH